MILPNTLRYNKIKYIYYREFTISFDGIAPSSNIWYNMDMDVDVDVGRDKHLHHTCNTFLSHVREWNRGFWSIFACELRIDSFSVKLWSLSSYKTLPKKVCFHLSPAIRNSHAKSGPENPKSRSQNATDFYTFINLHLSLWFCTILSFKWYHFSYF